MRTSPPPAPLASWPPRRLDLERVDWLALQLLIPQDVVAAGARLVARDAVHQLTWDGDAVRAEVDGHLTRIAALSALCGCGLPAPCACLAAALLTWVERRPTLLQIGAPTEADDLYDRGDGGDGGALADLLHHTLGSSSFAGRLDLADPDRAARDRTAPDRAGQYNARTPTQTSEGSPRLILELDGDISGRLDLDGHWLPSLLELEGSGVEIGQRLREARRPEAPLRPHVAAELDDDGAIALRRFYRVVPLDDDHLATAALPPEISRDRVDPDALGGWDWVGRTLHPVAPPAQLLARWWNQDAGRIRPERVFEFVRSQLPALRQCPQFESGPRLARARVIHDLEVRRVVVRREDDSPHFTLEPLYGPLAPAAPPSASPDYRPGAHEPEQDRSDLRLTLGELRGWRDEGRTRVRCGDAWVELPTEAEVTRFEQVFGDEADEPGRGRARVDAATLLRYAAEWGDGVEVVAEGSTEALVDRLLGRGRLGDAGPARPAGLACELRGYQRDGLAWLSLLADLSLGGVLADEMGLGKTVQALALLCRVHQHPRSVPPDASGVEQPSLVVCPRSVLDHWADQAARLAPDLCAHVHHGAERHLERDGRPPGEGAHLWLTTYETLVRDIRRLGRRPWRVLLLDEAHKAKNADTRIARALRKLQASARFGLTGTPIENALDELWGLFDLLLPGHLGTRRQFDRRFARPMTQDHPDPAARAQLARLIRPLVLRRRKREVLGDLPPKIESTQVCRLSEAQRELYRQALARRAPRLIEELADARRRIDYVSILAVLTVLKRVCDHPTLVLDDDERVRAYGADALAPASGKFELYRQLLAELLDAGHKVVVFSQYLGMLDLLGLHLDREGVGWTEIRGATVDRGAPVRRFRDDPDTRVFLASLNAGGVGIELTAATAVIHYDRWWNAAREDQATDRVHRIGQERGVLVYRLLTRGTIEDRIDQLIRDKGALAGDLLGDTPDPASAPASTPADDGALPPQRDATSERGATAATLGALRSFDRAELIALLSDALDGEVPETAS